VKRSILVTGFEPFGTVDHNPSAAVLELLPAAVSTLDVETRVLPVDTETVGPILTSAYADGFAAILHTGLALERRAITVERTAHNRRDFPIPDNGGRLVRGVPIVDGGPEQIEARLPVDRIVAEWRDEGIDGAPSFSAGTYLCNQVMYTSLASLPPSTPTGFIHLPPDEHIGGPNAQPLAVQARALSIALRILAALLTAVASFAFGFEARAEETMRGMTVSCPDYGQIWGTPAMTRAAREVRELGVTWVAIHPYGAVKRDGSVRFDPPEEVGYLDRAVEIAGEEGLSLFWNPHLAYWGTFEWRGSIDFGADGKAWARFFDEYEAFIVAHARFAERHEIPLLSVGIEYERMMSHEPAWRRIIAKVRKVYRGKITYAANWDGLDRVPFWDAVDLIGVQAYFPLTPSKSPSQAELDAGWDAILARLTDLSDRYGRPVLLTEIGYPRSMAAAAEPWKPELDNNPSAIALRARLLETALRRVEHPKIEGVFWWKWIPGANLWDRDFSMRDDEATSALSRAWKVSGAAPRGPSRARR
jgi:pyroglutamyl-peptidase